MMEICVPEADVPGQVQSNSPEPGHPSGERAMWSTSAMKYFSATKKRENLLSAAQWIVLEDTVLSETRNNPGIERQTPHYVEATSV